MALNGNVKTLFSMRLTYWWLKWNVKKKHYYKESWINLLWLTWKLTWQQEQPYLEPQNEMTTRIKFFFSITGQCDTELSAISTTLESCKSSYNISCISVLFLLISNSCSYLCHHIVSHSTCINRNMQKGCLMSLCKCSLAIIFAIRSHCLQA